MGRAAKVYMMIVYVEFDHYAGEYDYEVGVRDNNS